jgi:ABC-type phosphate/phosphonate transport system ATPase subunit
MPARRAVAATIEQVGLASKHRARVRTLSGGQLRRRDSAFPIAPVARALALRWEPGPIRRGAN